jgi:hypothetical protein
VIVVEAEEGSPPAGWRASPVYVPVGPERVALYMRDSSFPPFSHTSILGESPSSRCCSCCKTCAPDQFGSLDHAFAAAVAVWLRRQCNKRLNYLPSAHLVWGTGSLTGGESCLFRSGMDIPQRLSTHCRKRRHRPAAWAGRRLQRTGAHCAHTHPCSKLSRLLIAPTAYRRPVHVDSHLPRRGG